MSQTFRLSLKYKKDDSILEIDNTTLSKKDSIALVNHSFTQYLSKTILTIDGKALVDELNRCVYVAGKSFERKYYLFYIIDGKTYKQKTGFPDSYGLIRGRSHVNIALRAKVNAIKDDIENYDLTIYRGLDAYRKLGYKSVFGIIELKPKGKNKL